MRSLAIALVIGLLLIVGFFFYVKDDVAELCGDIQAYQRQSLLPEQ